MENLEIVKLLPEDWQQYKQIRLESLQVEPQAFIRSYQDALTLPDSYWQERLIEAQVGENSWLLFAKEHNRIIGITGAHRTEEPDVVEIISSFVKKERRGLGVSNALMTAILKEVSHSEIFRIARLVVNMDQTAAITSYHHFGFQIVGKKTRIMGDGKSHVDYVMEKDLVRIHTSPGSQQGSG